MKGDREEWAGRVTSSHIITYETRDAAASSSLSALALFSSYSRHMQFFHLIFINAALAFCRTINFSGSGMKSEAVIPRGSPIMSREWPGSEYEADTSFPAHVHYGPLRLLCSRQRKAVRGALDLGRRVSHCRAAQA